MKRKFEPKKDQKNPTNPNPKVDRQQNEFDIDKPTIKEQQNKE
ncbi:MAG: hypothetical protein R3359_05995 [Marinirhabdus sp.]|nr:hypothetical protein [Marinirhabdus sp.]